MGWRYSAPGLWSVQMWVLEASCLWVSLRKEGHRMPGLRGEGLVDTRPLESLQPSAQRGPALRGPALGWLPPWPIG